MTSEEGDPGGGGVGEEEGTVREGLDRSPVRGGRALGNSVPDGHWNERPVSTRGPRRANSARTKHRARRSFSPRMSKVRADSRRRSVRTEGSRFALMRRERWSRWMARAVSRLWMVPGSGDSGAGQCPAHWDWGYSERSPGWPADEILRGGELATVGRGMLRSDGRHLGRGGGNRRFLNAKK